VAQKSRSGHATNQADGALIRGAARTRAASPKKLTILLSGMMAGDPHQGGATWAVLQYLLGLMALGHDVYFVEPVASDKMTASPADASDPATVAYFRSVVRRFGLATRSALLGRGSTKTAGLPYDTLRAAARRCDLLINISGMLTDPALLDPIPVRLYLDLDPGFNQLWHAVEHIDVGFGGHTHFATIGPAIGCPDCDIPTCGLSWIPTRQPIVLNEWPPDEPVTIDAFTTVGNWRAYGSITYNGAFHGQKAHTFRRFMGVAGKSDQRFLLAMAIHPDEADDLARLKAGRWQLTDPVRAAGTPDRYREFVQRSKAEFGIAKSGYARSQCGWFSDRSVCYLASGRPVVACETGFSRFLPTGEGLFAFETEDEALAAVETIASNIAGHSRKARELAVEHFDAARVLPALLERVGVGQ
jgi:hypothetical protein